MFLVRSAHRSESGEHDIEGPVGTRELFGITLLEGDRQALCCGTRLSPPQEGWDLVNPHHLTPAARRRQRRVPVPRGDVEHLLARPPIDGFTQELTHEHQGVADGCVIANGPYLLLTWLNDGEIGHVCLPPFRSSPAAL